MRAKRPAAFTLIELLVVIGIIAVLVSILIPVLGSARASSQSVRCLSNLRQMAQYQMSYNQQFEGQLFPYVWYTPGNPGVAWNSFWIGQLERIGGDDAVRLCPSVSNTA